jgi:hypothetical protein
MYLLDRFSCVNFGRVINQVLDLVTRKCIYYKSHRSSIFGCLYQYDLKKLFDYLLSDSLIIYHLDCSSDVLTISEFSFNMLLILHFTAFVHIYTVKSVIRVIGQIGSNGSNSARTYNWKTRKLGFSMNQKLYKHPTFDFYYIIRTNKYQTFIQILPI